MRRGRDFCRLGVGTGVGGWGGEVGLAVFGDLMIDGTMDGEIHVLLSFGIVMDEEKELFEIGVRGKSSSEDWSASDYGHLHGNWNGKRKGWEGRRILMRKRNQNWTSVFTKP